jgi:AraC-like DNA-binding protein
MTEIFDNIRKLYRFKQPCAELADHVEFFSETSSKDMQEHIQCDHFTVKLFPSYTPTIWINLGTPYFLKNGNFWQPIDEHTDVLVLRNEIIERSNLPTDNIFTLKFFPGGFEAVLGCSQTAIGSEIVHATEVIPASLIKHMKRLDDFDDRMLLLQNWLLEKLHQQKKALCRQTNNHLALSYIRQAESLFCASGMEADNKTLAQQLFLTDKTLYRYFAKVVGTNPRTYLATVRARTALSAYVKHPATFSPVDHGYYDRSHFYKDVARFTGQKLAAFRS